jgi:hypothetical protein
MRSIAMRVQQSKPFLTRQAFNAVARASPVQVEQAASLETVEWFAR